MQNHDEHNQDEPLDTTLTPETETDLALEPVEDDTAANEQIEDAPEVPQVDYLEERVFGIPRMQFYGIVLGIGFGYVATGILRLDSVWIPSAVCMAAGYFIAALLLKKRKAAREAENDQG